MLPRTLSTALLSASRHFPVVLLTGPRQIGKTTLLAACSEEGRTYVSLDDSDACALAQNDPALFLQKYKPPLTIDEIQYAPALFREIKMAVDRLQNSATGGAGAFWLTGSQKFHLMQNITESLAGRVAILDMLGFSQAEITGRALTADPFLPTKSWIDTTAQRVTPSPPSLMDLYRVIWRGSFPAMVLNPDLPQDLFYKSYLQTYIQKDLWAITKIQNEGAFLRFLRVVAARTAQIVNVADMARDADIDHKTAKAWLSILETSGIVYLLYPYTGNVTHRLIKAPKLYFLESGLCAYITRWSSSEALEAGAMAGAILETYMFSEILKSYIHKGLSPLFYYYRDKDQKEIDLLIEQDNRLYPIEFKKTASPSQHAVRHFHLLEKLGRPIGEGAMLCLKETDVPLTREVHAIPLHYL